MLMLEMGPSSIRQVKKELRVLGITAGKRDGEKGFFVVGVVYRGSLWLDGVMKVEAQGPDLTSNIVEMIRSSPHYEQIRVLLLDASTTKMEPFVDPFKLSAGVSRPLIMTSIYRELLVVPEDSGARLFQLKQGGTVVNILSIGLPSREAERVLATASKSKASVPEALRVARLVSEAVKKCDRQNV